jgi:ABC-type lipoprotein export system ATPase subunit
LGASFFKRAQMSGISVTLAFLVLGIITQIVKDSNSATITLLSFLFTPVTYVNFLILMARYEKMNLGVDLLHAAPGSHSQTTGIVLWCFMIIQFLVYPLLGALVERNLYGTLSSARRTTKGNGTNETVRLKDFTKQYVPNWFKRQIAPLFGRRYETVNAVSGLTLTALKGQIVVLLGPNGSGKSTTLDTIAGLNQATSGSLEIDDTGGIGICPQKNVLWDDLSVIDHIRLFSNLKSSGGVVSDKDVKDLIRAIDLVAKTNSLARTLSGGQKRKLQLGLMLSGGSQVCCVDEVSSGLGKPLQANIRACN